MAKESFAFFAIIIITGILSKYTMDYVLNSGAGKAMDKSVAEQMKIFREKKEQYDPEDPNKTVKGLFKT